MRKRMITQVSQHLSVPNPNWLDLKRLAEVEITSEDAAHPIESALVPDCGSGWQAAKPGEQIIRLLFDEPQKLRRIRLLFHEDKVDRTQEFVLSWSPGGGRPYREILRQQYNFSPPHTARELEDYEVDLNAVAALELRIVPDISGRGARASLAQLRIQA